MCPIAARVRHTGGDRLLILTPGLARNLLKSHEIKCDSEPDDIELVCTT